MSQVLLGFRNLSFRIAVFVALAAVLAWFLGGDLFGSVKDFPRRTVTENRVSARAVLEYNPDSVLAERVRWTVEVNAGGGLRKATERWDDATDPVIAPDDRIYIGAMRAGAWGVWQIGASASPPSATLLQTLPDRLEVERQLGRLAFGLPLQTAGIAASAREEVLRQGDQR